MGRIDSTRQPRKITRARVWNVWNNTLGSGGGRSGRSEIRRIQIRRPAWTTTYGWVQLPSVHSIPIVFIGTMFTTGTMPVA